MLRESSEKVHCMSRWIQCHRPCGSRCPAPSPLGASPTGNGSVKATFSLGRAAFGKSAGKMAILEGNPTNALGTPCCLRFYYPSNSLCEVITNNVGVRQIKVPEGLADVVTNTATQYFI